MIRKRSLRSFQTRARHEFEPIEGEKIRSVPLVDNDYHLDMLEAVSISYFFETCHATEQWPRNLNMQNFLIFRVGQSKQNVKKHNGWYMDSKFPLNYNDLLRKKTEPFFP